MTCAKITNRILVIFLIFVSWACSDPDFDNSSELDNPVQNSGRLVLGKELRDPYDIDNINIALKSLKTRRPVPQDIIEPNHTYIRFLPGNYEEQELLKNDTSIILFDHPLNYEITGENLPAAQSCDSTIQWQYCVVPIDKVLPPVHHEVIYDVFIPPGNNTTPDSLSEFYSELVHESVIFTGNLSEDSLSDTKKSTGSKWIPKGTIRAWDDLLGRYIPLVHANVHARWFTHVESDLTDENGYFQMKDGFRYRVNYSIKWENSLFTIRDGNFLQAWFNGPKKKGDWNLDISGGKSIMFATIHRAAYRQFYGNNLGLFRPRLQFGKRTKIIYRDSNGTGRFLGDWSTSGILPDILIWGRKSGTLRPTYEVFGSTSHELGHQAHSLLIGNLKFYQTSNIIRESWAEAVEWAITNDEYNTLGRKYGVPSASFYNHNAGKHNRWPFVEDPDYSPIFIDLVDEYNQRMIKGPDYPNDMISKYSISFINMNLLNNASDIMSLQQEVSRHKMEGVDDFQIRELFFLY